MPFSCATKRVPPIKGNARFPENNGRIEAQFWKTEARKGIGDRGGWRPRADCREPSGSLSAKVSLDARVKYKTLILKSEILESRCVLFKIRYNARNQNYVAASLAYLSLNSSHCALCKYHTLSILFYLLYFFVI